MDQPVIRPLGLGSDSTPAILPPTAEDLLKRINDLGTQLRIVIVEAKLLQKDVTVEVHQDPIRSLGQAQVNLQVGFMWLRRAIKPQKEF